MTGPEPIIELKPPADCSKEDLHRFRDMVAEAGEVEEAGLDGRIGGAEMLALLRLGADIIGVGALKIPNQQYARKVFKSANAKNEARAFGLELGWVVVEEAHRRRSYARRIVEALVVCAAGQKIYATSVSTRVPMHRALSRCGFERDGLEWQSIRRPNESLFLFVHNGHRTRSLGPG